MHSPENNVVGIAEPDDVRKMKERIEYLEENRRFIQNSLEMVLSLSDFHRHLCRECDSHSLLREALGKFEKIIPLQGCAVYLVDNETSEFNLTLCAPENLRDLVSAQVEFMIEEGLFAWAVRERRTVFIPSNDHKHRFLLHVIANHSCIQGMLVGMLQQGKVAVPDASLSLLSITLLNLANVMESVRLYQWVKTQNDILEKKVAERTRKLDLSKQKLKQTMVSLEKMAREAEQANQAKSQFLANMSHEIRTPLNGIIGCSELMLKSDDPAYCRSLAQVSLTESEHLLHLINNVLDYSKIEANKIQLEQKPFDLNQLLEAVTAGLQIQARAKQLELCTQISGTPEMFVTGDALRLRQVLINLVNNAVKFTHSGSVTLAVERLAGGRHGTGQRLKFDVVDTGIGIPADRLKTIFNRFTQADQSTTRRYGGTGLGTTIAYQLVALMGGRLTVTSVPNQGTTFSFIIDLPAAARTDHPSPVHDGAMPETESAPEAVKTARILLAEDTPVNQLVIRSHLETCGHVVFIADNGVLAVEACRNQPFDLVLMDIQMPEMDGLEAARIIRRQALNQHRVPIVALTANTDVQTRDACKEAGMDDVLTKPIRREALLSAVQNHLANHGQPPVASATQIDPPASETAVRPLDLATAVYEFGDREMVRQVVEQLIHNGIGQIRDLRQAAERQDVNLIGRYAHALKGGAATAEAGPLAAAAAELEEKCRTNDLEGIPTAMGSLFKAFEELKQYTDTINWQQEE